MDNLNLNDLAKIQETLKKLQTINTQSANFDELKKITSNLLEINMIKNNPMLKNVLEQKFKEAFDLKPPK